MEQMLERTAPSGEESGFYWPTVDRPGWVPLDSLVPTKNQPRKHFDEDELKVLAKTMKGGKQREIITVRMLTVEEMNSGNFPPEARYMIKSGERRWRAARLAGLSQVEIRVREYASAAEEALDTYMLNEGRVGLSDIENAEYIAYLAELHGWKTQVEIAEGIGKSQFDVSQLLSLLKLSEKAKARLSPELPEKERFTREVGVFLARLQPDVQDDLVMRLPAAHKTGARQILWMADELKKIGVTLPTRKRDPRKTRSMVSNFIEQVCRSIDGFLSAEDFGRLFENASADTRTEILDRLRAAEGKLHGFIEKVESLPTSTSPNPRVRTHTPDRPVAAPTPPAQRRHDVTPASPAKPAPTPKPLARGLKPARTALGAPRPIGDGFTAARAVSTPASRATPPNDILRGITVNCWNGSRIVMDKVTPDAYLKLWQKGDLEFQRNGQPKPDHLPSVEEVRAALHQRQAL